MRPEHASHTQKKHSQKSYQKRGVKKRPKFNPKKGSCQVAEFGPEKFKFAAIREKKDVQVKYPHPPEWLEMRLLHLGFDNWDAKTALQCLCSTLGVVLLDTS